jgi:hypothetical protein
LTDRGHERIDIGNEFGISRRDLLRRGAIVGGTLLWAAPTVQSIAKPAVPNNDGDCVAACRSQGYSNHDFDSGLHSCSRGTNPCTPCSCS